MGKFEGGAGGLGGLFVGFWGFWGFFFRVAGSRFGLGCRQTGGFGDEHGGHVPEGGDPF